MKQAIKSTEKKWRMFEASITLEDGDKTTYISSTLGGEEEAKNAAINKDWGSPVVDVVVIFRNSV